MGDVVRLPNLPARPPNPKDAWGPLARLSPQALADLPVGALGHLVRLGADPLYRLDRDMPSLAAELRDVLPDVDWSDPRLRVSDIRDEFCAELDEANVDFPRIIRVRSRDALRSVFRKNSDRLADILMDLRVSSIGDLS